MSNAEEYILDSNPFIFDSDGDGLVDGWGGIVSTNLYPQGAHANADGFVDGELDYGTNPTDFDTDGDGLVDGFDGIISTTLYPWGLDMNGDGYVDGELDWGTRSDLYDSDGDGIDDGAAVFYGLNPTNGLASSGLNRNWLFHNSPDFSSSTWEMVPGLWQRFAMEDYDFNKKVIFFLGPTNAVLGPGETAMADVRFSWQPEGSGWTDLWVSASSYTTVTISANSRFHALPSLGIYTVQVYRAAWSMPAYAATQSFAVYYSPRIRSVKAGVVYDETYLNARFRPEDSGAAGYITNNWPFGVQLLGKDYFDRDYTLRHAPRRLLDGDFESGTVGVNGRWSTFGDELGIVTNIYRGGDRAFCSYGVNGAYQEIDVHPGEELVIRGYMFTPSSTNEFDPSPLTLDRYGSIAIEYLDGSNSGAFMRTDEARLYSTNSPDTWHVFSITSLVPNLAVSAHVTLRAVSPTMDVGGAGHVYFDDISVSVSPDTDHDGIPDWWELQYGLAPDDPTDAIADTDADGLMNIDEYRYGCNPNMDDTDSDGMGDLWEVVYGFNPSSAADANLDLDGDGLTNFQEYQMGTNPRAQDSDLDGLSDAFEVFDLHSDPGRADFSAFGTTFEVDGAAFSQSLGDWRTEDTDAVANGRRGYLEYEVNIVTGDIYRLEIMGANYYSNQWSKTLELRISVDGVFVERITLISSFGRMAQAGCMLPWLPAGSHTIRVFWDNHSSDRFLRLRQLRILSIPGPDEDANGVKDWVERRLNRLSGVYSSTLISATSPACVEGADPYLPFMNISTGSLHHGAGSQWYANIPLAPDVATPFTVSFQSGGKVRTNSVIWKPTNILEADSLTIRKGDALLLTAIPPEATTGTVVISVLGVTNYNTGVISPVVHTFNESGTFYAVGTYTPPSGSAVSSILEVNVLDGHFPGNPVAWVNVYRTWVCSNLSASVAIDHDPRLTVRQTNSGSGVGRVLNVLSTDPEERYLVARAGDGGPILTNAFVRGFRFGYASEGDITTKNVCDTGDQLIGAEMVASPMFDALVVRSEIIVGGITFSNGLLSNEWTAIDFDALGQCEAEFIRPAEAQSSFCHILDVYDGDEFLGRYMR